MVDSEADSVGSELFDVLVGLTAGGAVTIVRGSQEMNVRGSQEMNGFLAWTAVARAAQS